MAEADIHAPFRQEFDESTEMAGKPIPGFLCRVLVPEKRREPYSLKLIWFILSLLMIFL